MLKTTKIFLIMSIFMLITSVSSELKSQNCPSGFNSLFVNMNINGCDYEIEVCYACGTTAPYSALRVMGFVKLVPTCSQSWNTDQVVDYIWDNLITKDFIDQILDSCTQEIPPCDVPFSGDYYIERIEDICWYKTNIGGLIYYYPCYWEQVYCQTDWKICRLPNGEYRIDLYYGPTVSGNVETACPSSIEPPDPALNQQTSCFNLKTLCSPY